MQNLLNLNVTYNAGDWVQEKFKGIKQLPFYSSIDLRNSGYKMAPIDANLFPAGFNNFSNNSKKVTSLLIKDYLEKYKYKKALIIPENYTRNKMYIENVLAIKEILLSSGLETRIGLFDYEISNTMEYYEALIKESSILRTQSGFEPDVIILNRDMTSSIPDTLHDIKQNIIPSPLFGWHSRNKSKYFSIYKEIASEFCREFEIDAWLISALTEDCHHIDFNDQSSLEKVASKVDKILCLMKKKYDEYKIGTQPYVFIKASNGTYGMGIITVTSGQEVMNLNKKNRNKMKKVKDGVKIDSVIIQEGIPTINKFKDSHAEPLIYYIGNNPACYLYRCNNRKGIYHSLNSTDCEFYDVSDAVGWNKLSYWSIISKLAVLALSIEINS